MNNFYYHAHGCLWIVPPRCASTSIRVAAELGQWTTEPDNERYTIAFVRHPFDRVVSSLYTIFRHCPPTVETVLENIENSHLRPQRSMLDGLRVDFLGRFDCIEQDWSYLQKKISLPELRHLNRGNARPADWRSVVDWRRLLRVYSGDLELCPDW